MTYCVYRMMNKAGDVLYVGSSAHLMSRLGRHSQDKPWWPEVTSVVVIDEYADAATMRAAEQAAIDEWEPAYNRCRAVGKTPIRGFRIPDDLMTAAKAQAAANGETLTDVVIRNLTAYVGGALLDQSA